jgi:hypothetical protein
VVNVKVAYLLYSSGLQKWAGNVAANRDLPTNSLHASDSVLHCGFLPAQCLETGQCVPPGIVYRMLGRCDLSIAEFSTVITRKSNFGRNISGAA